MLNPLPLAPLICGGKIVVALVAQEHLSVLQVPSVSQTSQKKAAALRIVEAGDVKRRHRMSKIREVSY